MRLRGGRLHEAGERLQQALRLCGEGLEQVRAEVLTGLGLVAIYSDHSRGAP